MVTPGSKSEAPLTIGRKDGARRTLLDRPLSTFKVPIRTTTLWPWIQQSYQELRERGLVFMPPVWIGDEWFSPSDYPGVAVPFYLCDRRLLALQKRFLFIAEGSSKQECMRILRHEFAHAYETAFSLSKRPLWRKTFGNPNRAYPKSYRPDPFSDRFVHNLRYWYAQSHPHEDFAETFAVWLRPDFDWRRRYRKQPVALRKLEYVDDLMERYKGRRPIVKKPTRLEGDIAYDGRLLREYIEEQQANFGLGEASNFDAGLLRLFTLQEHNGSTGLLEAAKFFVKHKVTLRKKISTWTGAHPYLLDLILEDMAQRCRELTLYTTRPPEELWDDTLVFLTSQVMLHLSRHSFRISL